MQRTLTALQRKAATSTPCVCATLRKATRAVTLLYDEHLRPAGLRVTQYSLLKNVLAREPVSVNQLSEATVIDRTTLTRNLRVLRQRGLIRIQEGEDRRSREVTVTPGGREAVAKADSCWELAQAHVVGQVGAEHWRILREELNTMIALGRRR
jgi:DNA-binding MarR family transcriptional regulator